VTVGKIEWLLVKVTPASRKAAMPGAVSGRTICARKPSGTNRITLCGRSSASAFSEQQALSNNPVDSNARNFIFSPQGKFPFNR